MLGFNQKPWLAVANDDEIHFPLLEVADIAQFKLAHAEIGPCLECFLIFTFKTAPAKCFAIESFDERSILRSRRGGSISLVSYTNPQIMKRLPLILALLVGTSSLLSAFTLRSNDFPPDAQVTYRTVDATDPYDIDAVGEELKLNIFYPDGTVPTEPKPAILLFHGGGFKKGDPSQFYHASRYLTTRGMVAISVQYVLDNDGVTAVMDGNSAMRYVRANAATFGIDPNQIAAGGGSAGGALAAAISTSSIINHDDDNLSISAKPSALVLFNPIYYTTAFASWDQATRDDFTPFDNISADMAPALVMFGEFDKFVDVSQMEAFQDKMQSFGVRSELFIYENRGHAWFDNDREAVFETLKETDIFLESEGFLDGPPTIEAWLADYNNDVGTQHPTLTVTAPAAGATFSEGANLAVSADANDPDPGSSIQSVRIYLNGVQLRVDRSPPYAWGPGSGETDPELLNLSTGEYKIDFEARDDDGMWAKDSVTITVVEAPPAPPAPAGLAATAGDGEVSLDWTADSVTDPVTYAVYRSTTAGDYGLPLAPGLATNSYLDSDDVVNGTIYYYQVTASDEVDSESEPSAEVFAIPAAPGNQPPSFEFETFSAPGVEVGQPYSASIAAEASDPETDTLIFSKVAGPDWLVVGPDGSLSGTAPLETGPNSFTVRVDAAGGGDTATLEISVVPDDTAPPVPGGLSATAGDGSVNLVWSAASDADTASFSLYRAEAPGSFSSSPIAAGLTGTSFPDATAANGTTYFYALTAVDASGNESDFSDEVSATPELELDNTPPDAPTGLSANPGDASVALDWADNTEPDLAGYRIYRSTSSGSNGSALTPDPVGSSYSDSGLDNGTTYFYVVTAVDTSGNESVDSIEASATPSEATAVVVADYKFNGSQYTSEDGDTGSTASAIADGGGLNPSFDTRGTVPGQPVLKWTIGDFNDGTVLDDDYLLFTITPGSESELIFESLSFDFSFTANAGAQVYLYSSLDGFTEGAAIAAYTNEIKGINPVTIDLVELPSSSGPVEFRLYFDTAATFASGEAWIDNIELRATPQAISGDSDADGDGIDDAWETLYFGGLDSIDGSGDADGDGVLDYFEYLYGSIPTDAASRGFRFTAEGDPVDGTIRFQWAVESGFILGQDYQVYFSSTLSSWDPLPVEHYSLDQSPNGSRTQLELTITHDYGSAGFLRLARPEATGGN